MHDESANAYYIYKIHLYYSCILGLSLLIDDESALERIMEYFVTILLHEVQVKESKGFGNRGHIHLV